MQRRRSALAALCLSATVFSAVGCSAAGGDDQPAPPPGDDEKVTISVWSGFSNRELEVLNTTLEGFEKLHPNITIESTGSQDDDKISQGIRGGNPPDVAISFTADNVGQFCTSGSFQNLGGYIERDEVDLERIPEAVREYTEFDGERCALPLLTDINGLYYNKTLLASAGFSEPPKTVSELEKMAKALTKRDAAGNIEVAGFVPSAGFYGNSTQSFAGQWGATWQKENGDSNLADDPAWAKMLTWQKDLVDWYGYDKLTQFTSAAGQAFSADNDFYTGKIAMMFDGEYRTAFIDADAPQLDYGTAPMPTADDLTELYGGGYTTGTIIGIPKGAQHAGAAWELVKYLTTDSAPLVELANGLKNIPTTLDSLESPDLERTPQFQTFLDILADPHLNSSPATPNGGAYLKTLDDFVSRYFSGKEPDLQAGLAKVDQQIDNDRKLGNGP